MTLLYKYIADKGKLPFAVTEIVNTPEDIYRTALEKTASISSELMSFSDIAASSENAPDEAHKIFTLNAIQHVTQYLSANRDFMNEYDGQMKSYQGAEFATAWVYWDDISQRLTEARLAIRGIGLEGELHAALKVIARKIEKNAVTLSEFLS